MPDWLPIHFFRPDWLIGVPVAALLLVWHYRLQRAARLWRGRIAPHLLEHLIVRPTRRSGPGPAGWLFAMLALSSIALAGPSWERVPPPFADDDAALVIIVDLSPGMLRSDPAPSRLLHARLKLRDLLARHHNEKSALIAMGATAHRVLPFTQDNAAIRSYLDVLDPRLMPTPPGNRAGGPNQRFADALSLAKTMLDRDGGVGSVLLITDAPPTDLAAPISPVVWTIRANAPAPVGWAAANIRWTADNSDVAAVNRALAHRLQSVRAARDESSLWRDGGIRFLAPLVLLALFGARRGWSLRW